MTYGDMIGTEKKAGVTLSHGSLDTTAYTYNTGTMISGGAYLYEVTKDEKYLNQAKKSMESSLKVFGNDDLVEGFFQFPVATTIWFNLTLYQGYYDLLLVDSSASEYLSVVQRALILLTIITYMRIHYLPTGLVVGNMDLIRTKHVI